MSNRSLSEKYDGLFLSVMQVARELGLTKNEVISLAESKTLKSELIGEKPKFRIKEIQKYIDGETSGDVPSEELSLYKQLDINAHNTVIGGRKMYEGSISETKGRFIVQFDHGRDKDGKRRRESKTFKSRLLAEEYKKSRAEELNQSVRNKEYGEYTFKQYAEYYIELNINGARSRTLAGYSGELQAVFEHIGHIRIKELNKEKLVMTFNKLSKVYRENVLNKKWKVTKMILKYATASEHIEKDPTFLIKKPESEVFSPKESKAYTDSELERIIKAAKFNKEIYTMIRVLLSTGMRPGELRALKWSNYKELDKTVKIVSAATREYIIENDSSQTRIYKEIISYPKSKGGNRVLQLSDNTVEALKMWREYLDTYETESKRDSIYIFPGHDGYFLKEKTFSNKIYKFAINNGLKDIGITPYRFRHTLCTNLVLLKTPQEVTLKILGDKTPSLVTDVYSHISDDNKKDFSNKLFESNKNY